MPALSWTYVTHVWTMRSIHCYYTVTHSTLTYLLKHTLTYPNLANESAVLLFFVHRCDPSCQQAAQCSGVYYTCLEKLTWGIAPKSASQSSQNFDYFRGNLRIFLNQRSSNGASRLVKILRKILAFSGFQPWAGSEILALANMLVPRPKDKIRP